MSAPLTISERILISSDRFPCLHTLCLLISEPADTLTPRRCVCCIFGRPEISPVKTSSVLTCCSSMRMRRWFMGLLLLFASSSSGNNCLREVSTVAYESFTLLTDLKAGCCSNTEEVRFLSLGARYARKQPGNGVSEKEMLRDI
ncbi:Uncharacterized protein Rs2_35178 [Raphanus sativus]|nr:Uncharacterized protein Rs2_35178 [Raphanus sativus]